MMTVPATTSSKVRSAYWLDLTQAAANNPTEAYQRYGPALLRKAERVLRNKEDALDIVQGLFVDLICRPPPSLDLSYLFTAVTNRCLNHIRNQRVRTRLLESHAQDLCGSGRTNLGDSLLRFELVAQLVAALDAKSAQILVYHFIDDMNQSEVATHLGISRRALVKRLGKIRNLARDLDRQDSEVLEVVV